MAKCQNLLVYDPRSILPGQWVNLISYIDSPHMTSQYLVMHSNDPSLTHKGGERVVNLIGYIDCPHIVSEYLLTHSKAVKAIIREI